MSPHVPFQSALVYISNIISSQQTIRLINKRKNPSRKSSKEEQCYAHIPFLLTAPPTHPLQAPGTCHRKNGNLAVKTVLFDAGPHALATTPSYLFHRAFFHRTAHHYRPGYKLQVAIGSRS